MSMGISGVSQVGTGTQYEAPAVKSSEDKLSKKAQDYLADLRSKYGDYDFIVAGSSDDKKALVKQSTKSTSVVFSTSEMERMAKDEKYAAQKLKNVDTAVRNDNKIAEGDGVTYEKGSTQSSGLYSINKMSKADRSALVDQLKADMESRKSQLIDLVQKTLSGQVDSFGKASDENSIWRTLASGKFTVDAATKAQAQKDISEDGYWGVKQTEVLLWISLKLIWNPESHSSLILYRRLFPVRLTALERLPMRIAYGELLQVVSLLLMQLQRHRLRRIFLKTVTGV